MKSANVKSIRIKRSDAQIGSLLKEQALSDVTVKEFCRSNGISEATFYNWRNRSRRENKKLGRFIALQISKADSSGALFAEIELPGKAMIRLFHKVDPSWFKALL